MTSTRTTGPARRTRVCQAIPTARSPVASALATMEPADRAALSKLLTEQAEYVDHPDFRKKGIQKRLFGREAALTARSATRFEPVPSILFSGDDGGSLVGALSAEQEARLFMRFNYARFRVFRILWRHRGKRLSIDQARRLLAWHHRALRARSEITQANVPLVLAMAKRTRLTNVDFAELVSEGNLALLRSVDKFDCSRGFKFSTYACRAILKSFSRVAMRTSRYRGRFPTEFDPSLEKSDYLERKRDEYEADCVDDLRGILASNAAELSDIERQVIAARFALDKDPGEGKIVAKTLEEVGDLIGVTKERVRQIQNKALEKLRLAIEDGILAA